MQEMSQAGYRPQCTAQSLMVQVELPHCQGAHPGTFASLAITSYTVFTESHRQKKASERFNVSTSEFWPWLTSPQEPHSPSTARIRVLLPILGQNPCSFIPACPPVAEGVEVSTEKTCWTPKPVTSNYGSVLLNNNLVSSVLIWITQSKLAMKHFLWSLPKQEDLLLLKENI